MPPKTKKTKKRLDEEMVNRGLAPSKEKAQALVMAGDVLLDGQVVYRSHRMVSGENRIEIKEKFPYVSRGALKIEKALKDFLIEVKGREILDIGISTGGFSDYMLKAGAESIIGVDVNTRQVDYRLRQDKRLKLIEANARDEGELIAGCPGFVPDIITIDVSFISVTKILPALSRFGRAKIAVLVKPQFEARPEDVGKGGVIRDKAIRTRVLLDLKRQISALNFSVVDFTSAGIKGRKGNQEYFFLLEYGKKTPIDDKIIIHAIDTTESETTDTEF